VGYDAANVTYYINYHHHNITRKFHISTNGSIYDIDTGKLILNGTREDLEAWLEEKYPAPFWLLFINGDEFHCYHNGTVLSHDGKEVFSKGCEAYIEYRENQIDHKIVIARTEDGKEIFEFTLYDNGTVVFNGTTIGTDGNDTINWFVDKYYHPEFYTLHTDYGIYHLYNRTKPAHVTYANGTFLCAGDEECLRDFISDRLSYKKFIDHET